ncbi:sulfide:quinone oxidoreductase [Nitrosomonas ureae]|uniref:Sulfide:quinone oxidoreductase n=1 Tax=Nitrosomonas ureae TaxID=44577 RepID=A0A1H5XIZ8_9PROT|nr:sulfide:quinone oxidoreductase [Nitrosomonas ureae]
MSIVTTKLDEKLFVTRQISVNDLAEIAAVGLNPLFTIA